VSRVPPQVSGGSSHRPGEGGDAELEQLEELGDDAIIAQQQAAHAPVPRAQVTEEARSVVISDHPTPGSNPPSSPKIPKDSSGRKRSDRTEKTVVIRDRRQVEELRRQMAARKPTPPEPAAGGVLLWVIVGVAAFVTGGLVALLATRDDGASSVVKPAASAAPLPSAAPVVATAEPPKVSIDELPIEGSKKK
jgi:hypothetical protein